MARRKTGVFTASVAAGVVNLINPNLDLLRTHFLRSLYFQCSLTGTNTAGGGTVIQDGLARFFNFRMFLEGDDPVVSLRGDNLKTYLYNHYGQAADYTEITNVKGATTGTWNFEFPIADRKLRNNPRLTRVDLALADNPRIEMDFGQGSSVESTGDFVPTAASVTVFEEYDIRPAGLPGPETLARYLPLRRIREIRKSDLVASTTEQEMALRYGRLVREYHIIARDRSAAPARSDSLVARIELAPNAVRSGGKTWRDMLSETRMGLTVTPLVGAVVDDHDPTKQLVGTNMLNLIGARQMLAFVDTNALANNLELTFIEESIDFAHPDAIKLVSKFLR